MSLTSSPISPQAISSQMAQYRCLMDSLIHEKKDANLQDKKERAMALANKILMIGYPSDTRDKEFEIDIKNRIEEMCNLKVGRKLIKALAKILKAPKIQGKHIHEYIPIRKWNENMYSSQYKYVAIIKISQDEFKYQVTKGEKPYFSLRPPFITLGHELIHALHHFSASPLFDLDSDPDQVLLESMTDPDEQHTITGYNYRLFTKTELNKVDVICENAFLLTLGLLARTSHKKVSEGLPILEGDIPPNVTESYYEWLENQLKQKIMTLK